mmetsp:Transcript_23024/g.33807  ORF Transcript_23024/g.33807 Transcript_23024/m.33807 type:complete len:431 (-) Transcript_23024:81-1373(-)
MIQQKRQERHVRILVLLIFVTFSSQCHPGCFAFAPLIRSSSSYVPSKKSTETAARQRSPLLTMTKTTMTISKQEENDISTNNAPPDFSSMSSLYQPKSPTILKSYKHKKNNWTLTYRYKPASPGHENDTPLLLIHPVGIGLSSWFWDNFLNEWDGGEVYAPDLIGCGLENGVADNWIPEKQGLFFPLSWAEGCETLIEEEILSSVRRRKRGKSNFASSLLGAFTNNNSSNDDDGDGVIVVSQGGLAPVGVSIASRNSYPTSLTGKNYVKGLIMASPPKWNEMITPIPENNLSDQYDFFTSKVRGGLAFALLESKWAVEFFSNLFLFSNDCDDEWIERATGDAACKEARTPVMAFNAGFCNARSFEYELTNLEIKTLVLSGLDDEEREEQRRKYGSEMKNCVMESLRGKNVLPWESPVQFCVVLREFVENI